jgi:hypothetical protein
MGKWETISLVSFSGELVDIKLPFTFFPDVDLCEMPNWMKEKPISTYLRTHYNIKSNEDIIQYILYRNYSASSIIEPDIELGEGADVSKLETSYELIKNVNLALWISKTTAFSVHVILNIEQNGSHREVRYSFTDRSLYPLHSSNNESITQTDLDNANIIHSNILGLDNENLARISLYNLWIAITESQWIVRYILLWVILESLFGPKDKKEIAYRISHRIASFFGSNMEERKSIFNIANKGYSLRSTIVHGSKIKKIYINEDTDLRYEVESLVQKSLKKILLDNNLIKIFSSGEREKYLDNLIFS